MSQFSFDIDKVLLTRLAEDNLPDLVNFDCGDNEMNIFLRDEAFDEQGKGLNSTTLLYYQNDLAAFCSICCDSILLSPDERQEIDITRATVPAIKIARLGRDLKYRKLKLGIFLIEYIKNLAYELSETVLGVRLLTLDAYPERVKYYSNINFSVNEEMKRRKRRDGAVSMRIDIFD